MNYERFGLTLATLIANWQPAHLTAIFDDGDPLVVLHLKDGREIWHRWSEEHEVWTVTKGL